jgi:tetratricopeptide (TPR) repeat protein
MISVQLSQRRHESYLDLLAENFSLAVNAVDLSVRVEESGDEEGGGGGELEQLKARLARFEGGWPAVNALLTARLQTWRRETALRLAAARLAAAEGEWSRGQDRSLAAEPARTGPPPSSGLCSRLWSSLTHYALQSPSTASSVSKDRALASLAAKLTGLRANLAALLHGAGRFDEAEALYKQLLRDQILRGTPSLSPSLSLPTSSSSGGGGGENHPFALAAAGNLAVLLRARGKVDEAEQLYRRVLVRKQKVLGAAHPSSLATEFNLAALLRSQPARRREALDQLRGLRTRQQSALGRDHADCLLTLETLIALLLEQDEKKKEEEKEEEEEEALSILQELRLATISRFGSRHPQYLQAIDLQAALLLKRGSPDLALPLLEEALAGREVMCGLSHPSCWAARLRLATALRLLGRVERARELFQQLALAIPLSLSAGLTAWQVKETLGELCLRSGRAAQAEEVLRALVTSSAAPSASSLSAEFLLAEAMAQQGSNRLVEAEQLHRDLLTRRRTALGWSHADTFRSMHALANTLALQQQWGEARQLLEQALEGLDTVLGPRHRHSLAAAEALWKVCLRLGDLQRVEVLQLRLGSGTAEGGRQKEKTKGVEKERDGSVSSRGSRELRRAEMSRRTPVSR